MHLFIYYATLETSKQTFQGPGSAILYPFKYCTVLPHANGLGQKKPNLMWGGLKASNIILKITAAAVNK